MLNTVQEGLNGVQVNLNIVQSQVRLEAMALSRDEVVQGALALLEKVGLDALTMRRLAEALGVQAGAIYWHFKNKQELVDAMADAMMAGLGTPLPLGTWQEQLAELARRMAAALLKRRDAARLASQALKPGPHSLNNGELMLRIIASSGRSQKAVMWAASVVGYYILGFVTDMQAQADAVQRRGLLRLIRDFKRELSPKAYPELSKFTAKQLTDMVKGKQAQERFEYGLQAILRGISGATVVEGEGVEADGAAKAVRARRPYRRR
jgi:TetR/AcrR family tetracycline transcriptional repressor